MENASKALIIAGAILLSILIISLGIMIYRQAAGVAQEDQMSQLSAQTFNSKLEQYFGTKVNGSNANALIDYVNGLNRTQEDASKKVTLTGCTETSSGSGIYKKDKATGKTYTIEEKSSTTGGYINNIEIKENT